MLNQEYDAYLPRFLASNKSLTSSAKMIYADMLGLCDTKGYCTIPYSYYINRFNISKRTISRAFNQLAKYNFITITNLESTDKHIKILLSGFELDLLNKEKINRNKEINYAYKRTSTT